MDGEPHREAFGLRERKFAKTRAAIADALERALGSKDFVDVTVDELADAAEVSRATFFNHFESKHQALDYMLLRWLYATEATITDEALSGVAAIVRVFALMGERVMANPAAYVRTVGAVGPTRRALPSFRPAEIELATGGRFRDRQPMTTGQLFLREIAVARARGELRVPGTDFELAHLLGSLLTGAGTIGHSMPGLDYAALYRAHVASVLRLDLPARQAKPKTPQARRRR